MCVVQETFVGFITGAQVETNNSFPHLMTKILTFCGKLTDGIINIHALIMVVFCAKPLNFTEEQLEKHRIPQRTCNCFCLKFHFFPYKHATKT